MSIEAINAARKLVLPPRDKFVLLALADYANDEGEAFPRQGTIAEWTCYNRTTVNEALSSLEASGLIETRQTYRDDGGKSVKVYRLTFLNTPHVGDTDKGMSATPTRGCRPGQQGDVGDTNSNNHQEGTTKKEQRETRARAKHKKEPKHEFDPATVDLPPQFDRQLFTEFCAERLRKKRPMTERALRQFLKSHGDHSKPTLDLMFRKAIVAGWLDLYPLDKRRTTDARASPKEPTEREYRDVNAADLLKTRKAP